ncbi:hypothetical protein [Hyphomonas sp.]|uniref:hypothetical protein n=1 Tax=Hyphomonas sp. TaxID=87 RepID=UPI00391AB877
MRVPLCLWVVVLVLSSASSPALAQDIATEPELRNPTVIVTGSREEQAAAFVKQVQPQGWAGAARGVPRWNSELCISVIGPPVAQGQFIADRISARAMTVGLEAGAPGCDTNLLVIVTDQPETLLPRIAQQHRAVFGFTGDANIDTGGSDVSLADFIAEDRPVRWRQVVQTVGADGMPLDGDTGLGKGGLTNVPVARSEGTRLRSAVRRELSRVIAVVDTRHTAGLSLTAVSDYLAFVSLADVSPESDLASFPSILNLFNPAAERQTEMSDWDIAFLDGLYKSRSDAPSGRAQYREIAKRIADYEPGRE